MDKNTKITIAISVAVIAIFLIALSFIGKGKTEEKADLVSESTITASTSVDKVEGSFTSNLPKSASILANKTAGLSVVDQLAGDEVAFSGVNFEDDTWVVVYEDKNGELSNLIGAGLFFGGITEGVSPVLRPTVAGSKYYVTIIKDNGDRVFDIKEDKPVALSPIVSFIAK